MNHLNPKFWELLSAEIQKYGTADRYGQVQRDIVIKRLQKLRMQPLHRLTETEIYEAIYDIFPNFDRQAFERSLKSKLNSKHRSKIGSKLKWIAAFLLLGTGTIALANIPHPLIRKPVAKMAPILLLPSYMGTSYHYRQAIATVEQADRLINEASSPADLQLGAQKVAQAKEHLDALPVGFVELDHIDSLCGWFDCNFRFTVDQFQAARTEVGRMEAVLFQEQNAQTQLEQTEAALLEAREQFDLATTASEKSAASAAWQTAIDRLSQIPMVTLAGQIAQGQKEVALRDFEQISGTAASRQHSSNAVEAAKLFAMQAAKLAQNSPHSAQTWSNIAQLWQTAIDRLEQVRSEDPGYLDAQTKLAEYTANQLAASNRKVLEENSVRALQSANDRIAQWQHLAANNPKSPQLVSSLQEILNDLERVKPGTTAFNRSQELQQFAQQKLQELR
jgi:hypothetical protein